MTMNKKNLPVTEKIAEQVICLPIYTDISNKIMTFQSIKIKNIKMFLLPDIMLTN